VEDITTTLSGTGWTYNNNVWTITGSNPIIISGHSTTGQINIDTGGDTANLTMQNLFLGQELAQDPGYFDRGIYYAEGAKAVYYLNGASRVSEMGGADKKTNTLEIKDGPGPGTGMLEQRSGLKMGTLTISSGLISVQNKVHEGAIYTTNSFTMTGGMVCAGVDGSQLVVRGGDGSVQAHISGGVFMAMITNWDTWKDAYNTGGKFSTPPQVSGGALVFERGQLLQDAVLKTDFIMPFGMGTPSYFIGDTEGGGPGIPPGKTLTVPDGVGMYFLPAATGYFYVEGSLVVETGGVIYNLLRDGAGIYDYDADIITPGSVRGAPVQVVPQP
jgi:hypothetical protein